MGRLDCDDGNAVSSAFWNGNEQDIFGPSVERQREIDGVRHVSPVSTGRITLINDHEHVCQQ